MNEAEIQAKLQQTAQQNAEPHIPAPPTADQPEEPAFQSNISLGDPVISTALVDFFELSRADKYSEERQHQLKTVLEWASAKAQSNDIMEILLTLQRKESEVGRNVFRDRLQTMYKLAKLEAQANFVNMEMRNIYG